MGILNPAAFASAIVTFPFPFVSMVDMSSAVEGDGFGVCVVAGSLIALLATSGFTLILPFWRDGH